MNPSPSHSDDRAGYDPSYFARLLAIEDRHFWFRSRNHVISIVASQIIRDLTPGYRVLEVGCGTGNVLRVLEQVCRQGIVVGMDPFSEGLQCARQRTQTLLVQGDVHHLPFRKEFEIIGLFDVLEHLPDDEQVLRTLHALVAPKGALLLTVPAHPTLWSYFDEASRHVRRYTAAELESRIVRAGFAVEYLTLYMASIFPLIWLKRRLTSLVARPAGAPANRIDNLAAGELRITPVLNGLLSFLLNQESRLIARRRRLPIGASLLAVARRE